MSSGPNDDWLGTGQPTASAVRYSPQRPRFPGIVADARSLGCDRITLYRVLTGEFKHLTGLRRRYAALKSTQATTK